MIPDSDKGDESDESDYVLCATYYGGALCRYVI